MRSGGGGFGRSVAAVAVVAVVAGMLAVAAPAAGSSAQPGDSSGPFGDVTVDDDPVRADCTNAAQVFWLLCDVHYYLYQTKTYLDPVDEASLAAAAARAVRDAGLAAISGTAPICAPPSDEYEQVCVEIDKVQDTAAAVFAAAKGMVDSLNNPHSRLLTPAQDESALNAQARHRGGLGFELGLMDGQAACVQLSASCRPVVKVVHPGSPAESAGMVVGDVLVELGGPLSSSLDCLAVFTLPRFVEGGQVTVKVERDGNPVDFNMTPVTSAVPTLWSKVVDSSIGYLRIESFPSGLRSSVADEVQDLLDAGITRLVLDLRLTSGTGSMLSHIGVTGLFIPSGSKILTLRDRDQSVRAFAEPPPKASSAAELPMVVLVDERVRVEVIPAALADHHRATIVGKTTSGRGRWEEGFSLPRGSGDRVAELVLTTSEWSTPNGLVLTNGLTPDTDTDVPPCAGPDRAAQLAFGLPSPSPSPSPPPPPSPSPSSASSAVAVAVAVAVLLPSPSVAVAVAVASSSAVAVAVASSSSAVAVAVASSSSAVAVSVASSATASTGGGSGHAAGAGLFRR